MRSLAEIFADVGRLDALKGASAEALAAAAGAMAQAEAAVRASHISGRYALVVGALTLAAGAFVVFAAKIQAKAMRDQDERKDAADRAKEERAASERRKSTVAIIAAELAGHMLSMRWMYRRVLICQAIYDVDECASLANCPTIAAVGSIPKLFINDIITSVGDLKDPDLIRDILSAYGMLRSFSEANDAIARLNDPYPIAQWRFVRRSLVDFLDNTEALIKRLCESEGLAPPNARGDEAEYPKDTCFGAHHS